MCFCIFSIMDILWCQAVSSTFRLGLARPYNSIIGMKVLKHVNPTNAAIYFLYYYYYYYT